MEVPVSSDPALEDLTPVWKPFRVDITYSRPPLPAQSGAVTAPYHNTSDFPADHTAQNMERPACYAHSRTIRYPDSRNPPLSKYQIRKKRRSGGLVLL